ncbi:RimJ/RimL family protein N-acetyltransferase [Flagellimonas aquimarina]|uniref:RimJ/RimL family protein N-acetyltransferase n=1 Tax=Flagellimonas aquimarina TaxID=2201895 RepID=A0A316L2L2_9FLAO|nr:RimJ/RimL family protein N-acetyltransferase [Allomuricauda koreensis]
MIETERLIICEAQIEDSKFFKKLLNSPNWIEFIGDRGVRTDKQAVKYIKSSLIDSYNENGYGLYKMCLKKSSTPIGICGFVKRDYLDNPDIGFAILPEHEGKGYTTEACMATMTYGKSELKLSPILGITTQKNSKSRHLLSKIGLQETGKITPKGGNEELLLFST